MALICSVQCETECLVSLFLLYCPYFEPETTLLLFLPLFISYDLLILSFLFSLNLHKRVKVLELSMDLIGHYFLSKGNNSIQKAESLSESELDGYLKIYKKGLL